MRTGETTFRTGRGQARPPAAGAKPRRLARAGFTLTEIMIAMGVLAIGMGMVAGALHAGIQLHVRTIDDIMRQLIGDNALAIVQARVRHSASNGITAQYQLLGASYFGAGDLKYPWNTTNVPNGQPRYGAAVFMKLGRSDAGLSNDYDVLIVPYTVTPQTATSSPGEVNSPPALSDYTVSSDGLSVTGSGVSGMATGTVVFDNRDGSLATVKSVAGSTASLTAKLQAGSGTKVTLTVLTPSNSADRIECSKPVQTKTALSPSPSWTPGA